MRNPYDPTLDAAGYADCVLDSSDDYEPYGYVRPELQLKSVAREAPNRNFDRAIEAQLLAHSSMVGC
ncbi:MAG: hypothetical protein ACK2VD_09115 [Anaerolineae bacterium]|jgi:hypothetical protein